MERYFNVILKENRLEPAMFDGDAFLNYSPTESFWDSLPQAEFLTQKFPSAIYVGEKLPRLYERFHLIANNFPRDRAVILFIFRDPEFVCKSYQTRAKNEQDLLWPATQDWRVGLNDWKNALKSYKEWKNKLDILPVRYEAIFGNADSKIAMENIYNIFEHLNLPALDESFVSEVHKRFVGRVDRSDAVENENLPWMNIVKAETDYQSLKFDD